MKLFEDIVAELVGRHFIPGEKRGYGKDFNAEPMRQAREMEARIKIEEQADLEQVRETDRENQEKVIEEEPQAA